MASSRRRVQGRGAFLFGNLAQKQLLKIVQSTQKIDCKKVIEKGLTNGAGVCYTL